MDSDFDFQEWSQLARTSPEAFERRRQDAIAAFIAASCETQQQMGTRLQREIDYEIRRAGDPQQALAAIARMMWAQVAFLGEELAHLSDSMRELEVTTRVGAERLGLALQAIEARR